MEFKCAVCDSNDLKIIYTPSYEQYKIKNKKSFTPTASDFGIFYDLARCKDCGVIFSLINAKATELEQPYIDSKDELYTTQLAERSINYDAILREIKKLVPERSRLLDVGSSYGLFLSAAKKNGLETEGVEISRAASKYSTEKLNLRVSCVSIKDAVFPDSHFDVITALDFIEHLKNPRVFAEKAYRLLKPSGILYLTTPNIKSLSARLLGYRWWSYRKMHIYYFSKESLSALLKRTGFSVISVHPYRKAFKIGYILEQFGKAANNSFYFTIYKLASILAKNLRLNNLIIKMGFGDIVVIARKNADR